MRSYEQLIEYIINDETEKAKELFHALVVDKSRDLYNEIVAEEMEEETEEMDEAFGDDDSMDQTDDMMGDIEADHDGMDGEDEFGDEDHEGHEHGGDMEDRVMDLEDALDELKAEFEALMADEAGEEEHHDGVNDPDFGDMGGDMGGEEEAPAENVMREYVEKVKDFYKGDNSECSSVGSNSGSVTGATNHKSIVAGKNDMGGTAQNIARGGKNEDPDGKSYKDPSNQYTKGRGNLKGSGNFENVPGANAGKTFKNAKKPTSSEPSGVNKKIILPR